MLLDEKINDEFFNNILDIYKPEFIFSSGIRLLKEYELEELEINDCNFYLFRKINVSTKNKPLTTKLLLSTSGSTGSSKFVRLSAQNIHSNAASISQYLNITEQDIAITSLSMHYSFGLSVVNSHLFSGSTIVLTNETVTQKNFWEIFKEYNCTTFSGVPYTYQILHKLKLFEQNLPSLEYFTQAGGHLVSSIKKYFYDLAEKQSKKFIVMYGQTEAAPRISYVPFEKLEHKIDSIGIAIPNGHLTISDEIDIIDDKEIGELVYEGPNVMLGYAKKKSDIFKNDELMGVLYTGDLGYKDSAGYFYVTGREKRFIKLYGNRINLDDVERLIESKNKINCAVTGDDNRILVLLENVNEEKVYKILNELSNELSIHHSAIKGETIQRIPVSFNSKKDYNKIKHLFKS
jgi:acyl-CoA synthetase (AMP-forming)/AMP-acid ligase II